MDKQLKGKLGEDAVCTVLERRGHTIIERNYSKAFGEVDIISVKDGFIVFTEVKARQHGSMVSGLEAVDGRKRRRIILTADAYLTENPVSLQPRYDIAQVTLSTGTPPVVERVDIYEDAFTTDGIYTVN